MIIYHRCMLRRPNTHGGVSTDLTERGDLLQWWRYRHSNLDSTNAVCAFSRLLEPGFHFVLQGGEECCTLPGKRQDIFQIIPQGDLQVSLG